MNLSINMIHRGDPAPLLRALDSAYGALYREGDEAVIVDTGSTPEQLAVLREKIAAFPGARLVERPDLCRDYRAPIRKLLGNRVLRFYESYYDGAPAAGIFDFAQARQVAQDASQNPVIFWLDSDDVVAEETRGDLRRVIDENLNPEDPRLDALFLEYQYSFTEDGVCNTLQRRERVFFRDRYRWVGRCHETAIPRDDIAPPPRRVGCFEALKSCIVHTDARKPPGISDVRNYIILATEHAEMLEGKVPYDPRTTFYLANAARGLLRFEEATRLYKMFDSRSGSRDDRFAAHYYRAAMDLDESRRRPLSAVDSYLQCIMVKPHDPRGYFGLSRAYAALYRWNECLRWYEIGRNIPMPPNQVFSYDPQHIHYAPHIVAALAFRELGQPEKMMEAAHRAAQFRPGPDSVKMLRSFAAAGSEQRVAEAVKLICGNITHGGPNAVRVARHICTELRGPNAALEQIGIAQLEGADERTAPHKIVIYCGPTGEPWGPENAATGIGGSEKMVILLARALQATGRVDVTVYADVPQEQRGTDSEGVLWRHFAEIDVTRPVDVLISWRNPGNVALGIPAAQRILWNHDVVPDDLPRPIKLAADFVQFQSKFHAAPMRDNLLSGQLWIARNAVDTRPELEAALAQLPRDPKQVLYCSSPDRGLLTAARIVAAARQMDPGIKLIVTYGVTPLARKMFAHDSHRFCPDTGGETCMDLFERRYCAALDAAGATVLHRIGFDKMAALQQSSGVWLYPTRFPEISCMSAMEAQARGCVPLATRFGALAETILPEASALAPPLPELPQSGEVSEEYIQEAARLLVAAVQVGADDPRRLALATAAKDAFSVDTLAAQWLQKLNLVLDVAPVGGQAT